MLLAFTVTCISALIISYLSASYVFSKLTAILVAVLLSVLICFFYSMVVMAGLNLSESRDHIVLGVSLTSFVVMLISPFAILVSFVGAMLGARSKTRREINRLQS